jgi:tetratricopeptide (TPR) repeat protein
MLGELRQALTSCQQALTLHQELDNRAGLAAAWDSLGYIHHCLGHHTQAFTCYQHALTLCRDSGDRYGEADLLAHLGGAHQAARDAWQHALAILDDINHPTPTRYAPNSLALTPQPLTPSTWCPLRRLTGRLADRDDECDLLVLTSGSMRRPL